MFDLAKVEGISMSPLLLDGDVLLFRKQKQCAAGDLVLYRVSSALLLAKRVEEIKNRSGYSESDVIKIMRKKLKPSSFKLWRKRAKNQSIKHRKKFELSRKEIRRKIKKNDYI